MDTGSEQSWAVQQSHCTLNPPQQPLLYYRIVSSDSSFGKLNSLLYSQKDFSGCLVSAYLYCKSICLLLPSPFLPSSRRRRMITITLLAWALMSAAYYNVWPTHLSYFIPTTNFYESTFKRDRRAAKELEYLHSGCPVAGYTWLELARDALFLFSIFVFSPINQC